MNVKEYFMRQKQLETLDALGIVVWKERDANFLPLRGFDTCSGRNDFNKLVNEFLDHSGVNTHQSSISSIKPYVQKLNARCWVLLQASIEDSDSLKILEGMLKVLNLSTDSYCTSSIRESDIEKLDGVALLNSLMTWYPKTVLVLGSLLGTLLQQAQQAMESSSLPLPFTLKMTYHPSELLLEPQKKKQAYRELLELKEVLEKSENLENRKVK